MITQAKEKNECAKTRKKEQPYEVWQDTLHGWTWRVLKKYQTPSKERTNPYARWYCFVTSPMCPYGEYGDVYISEIKSQAILTGTMTTNK